MDDNVNNTNATAVKDNLELFKQALNDAMLNKEKDIEKDIEDVEYTPSRRHKIRMNRIFRERVGGKFLPYPEADNIFERMRSKIVVIFRINDILDKKKSNIKRKKK